MKNSLIAEWDYDLNLGIDPNTVADQSNKKFYWKCPKGHPSYLMPVNKRYIGHGCPVCSNHKIIKGINDLTTTNAELMDEWAWEENEAAGFDPTKLSFGSSYKVWWKCRNCGNTWDAIISNRTRLHSGCPYCSNLKVKKGFNDLATLRPDLVEEWYQEKNGDLTPDQVVECYAKKVWWKCKTCGNIWEATPNARKRRGCPYCCNHVKIPGFNDFESQHPEFLKEWDYEKNSKLPSEYASGSEAKVWWRCEKGHSWKAQIKSRVRGNGCPYCGNQKVLVGFNDLFTTNPELQKEWDFDKNTILTPDKVTAGTTKKAWWLCKECGNSWQASIYTRANGYGCPECGRKKSTISRLQTMAERNPLFVQFPELLREWDFEKNSNIDISLLPASSNKYAWWKCEKGHSFKQMITSRTRNNAGCPYCHGQKVLTGINDLQTLNPKLAEEWDYEKNYPLTPSEVFSHATRKVWWKCPVCGNSWYAKIHNRANGRGCPKCNERGTSFIEQVLFYYIKKVFPDALNRYLFKKTELDIYIPSLKTAIEYDGSYFHSGDAAKIRDNKKDKFCKDNYIQLIRLREKPLGQTENAINISCDCSNWGFLESTCEQLMTLLCNNADIEISIKKDYPDIIESKRSLMQQNSFAKQYPELLKEWDYEKNAPLIPDYFSYGSDQSVWWKCKECHHSWMTRIASRCKGAGCPKCGLEKSAKGRMKPVVMIDPYTMEALKFFDSVIDASNKTGINNRSISSVCRGKLQKAGGYIWSFMEDLPKNLSFEDNGQLIIADFL